MSTVFLESARRLEKKAKEYGGECLVGYSGGKESLCVIDLCARIFQKIVPYHLYFLPNLSVMEESIKFAMDRWGLKVITYPGKIILGALRDSLYRPVSSVFSNLPVFKALDTYNLVRHDTGLRLLALGHRKADSLSRRRMFARIVPKKQDEVYPLEKWSKWDVLSYLRINKLPLPPSDGSATSGVSLYARSILWLHDSFPEDYEKVRRVFPDITAVLKRREFHSVGQYFGQFGPATKVTDAGAGDSRSPGAVGAGQQA